MGGKGEEIDWDLPDRFLATSHEDREVKPFTILSGKFEKKEGGGGVFNIIPNSLWKASDQGGNLRWEPSDILLAGLKQIKGFVGEPNPSTGGGVF